MRRGPNSNFNVRDSRSNSVPVNGGARDKGKEKIVQDGGNFNA